MFQLPSADSSTEMADITPHEKHFPQSVSDEQEAEHEEDFIAGHATEVFEADSQQEDSGDSCETGQQVAEHNDKTVSCVAKEPHQIHTGILSIER